MRLLNEERGLSLVEVVASIVLFTIILLSFFTIFIQSKKTNILSESVVEATYFAQQDMEGIYGIVSSNSALWLKNTSPKPLKLKNKEFLYDSTDFSCMNECKKYVNKDNTKYWIKLTNITDENAINNDTLVQVVVNVPKENSPTSIIMESIFRWGNKP
ncbi:type IV pilus modification PilV family protein [Solibacillus sp. NPDC093137]|uniref:type IV pilus modification PilV family protein n=1 Tax=Solibacillus sp. NPDC093137 TaxID=3390678 RepID=UPI003CFD5564